MRTNIGNNIESQIKILRIYSQHIGQINLTLMTILYFIKYEYKLQTIVKNYFYKKKKIHIIFFQVRV